MASGLYKFETHGMNVPWGGSINGAAEGFFALDAGFAGEGRGGDADEEMALAQLICPGMAGMFCRFVNDFQLLWAEVVCYSLGNNIFYLHVVNR